MNKKKLVLSILALGLSIYVFVPGAGAATLEEIGAKISEIKVKVENIKVAINELKSAKETLVVAPIEEIDSQVLIKDIPLPEEKAEAESLVFEPISEMEPAVLGKAVEEPLAAEPAVSSTEVAEAISSGPLAVSLASDSPADQLVMKGEEDVVFLKFKIANGNSENVRINFLNICALKLKAGEMVPAESSDITRIRLYDGDNQLGYTESNLGSGGCVKFSPLGLMIPSGGSKALTVTASILYSAESAPLFIEADGSESQEGIGLSSEETFGFTGKATGNRVLAAPADEILVYESSASKEISGINTESEELAFEFIIKNPLDKKVVVKSLSLKLKGGLEPEDFGAIKWKLNGKETLGASYFGTLENSYGFTTVSNAPLSVEGKTVIPVLFEIDPRSEARVGVYPGVKDRESSGDAFSFSLAEAFYINTEQSRDIFGFPVESNSVGVIGPDCYDSDGGFNEYVYGRAYKDGYPSHDTCVLGNNLKEWMCTGAGEKVYKLVECSLGCVDGVCRRPGGNDGSTGVYCSDSDEGRDYGTYGFVKHGAESAFDYDECQSDKVLREYYCDQGYFAYEDHECSNYCSSGICVGEGSMDHQVASVSDAASNLLKKIEDILNP